jgi:hypothetical protein
MMKKTKLAHAVALAITGTALSFGAVSTASATTTSMYNLSTGGGSDASTNTSFDPASGGSWAGFYTGATDGWTNGAIGPSVGDGTGASKWAGTSGVNNTPFGYTGAHLNWGFEITGGAGGTGEISTYDAHNTYGVYADIDSAKGAWAALNTGTNTGGWRHDLDTGLFKTDTSGTVTLSVQGILSPTAEYGFTVFKGMDAVTGYNHHGQWNDYNNTQAGAADGFSSPYNNTTAGTPFSPASTVASNGAVTAGTPLDPADIVAYSVGGATPGNLNTISFNAEAGEIYTIFLGGYKLGNWGDTTDGYELTISQTPVPVPGAVWLFGSALAGFAGVNRRKRMMSA